MTGDRKESNKATRYCSFLSYKQIFNFVTKDYVTLYIYAYINFYNGLKLDMDESLRVLGVGGFLSFLISFVLRWWHSVVRTIKRNVWVSVCVCVCVWHNCNQNDQQQIIFMYLISPVHQTDSISLTHTYDRSQQMMMIIITLNFFLFFPLLLFNFIWWSSDVIAYDTQVCFCVCACGCVCAWTNEIYTHFFKWNENVILIDTDQWPDHT